jgi:nucleotide-binding universal stress UspA family protein
MFHHLLIPLDGSDLAEAALPVANELAARSGARVTLLHVLERNAPANVHGERHLRAADEAEDYLRSAAQRFAPGITVHHHVHEGGVRDLARSVAQHEDEMEPDLVVMCAHGDRRLRDWLSGSIPQQVVRQGQVPLLLLQKSGDGGVSFPFRQILAPLDGSEAHERGLAPAEALAGLCRASLELLTVVPTVSSLSGHEAATGSLLPEAMRAVLGIAEEESARYLAPHLERLTREGVCTHAVVSRGDPCEAIAERATETGADLIALGTHGRAGTDAFWSGSMAQRLIRRLPVSFLLTPVA